jgi:hypothetical protein
MKKQGGIASLFRNHAAKRQKFIVSTPQEQEEERINEEIVNPMPSAPSPPTHFMMLVVFHMTQVKDNLLQVTMLMIMMQFEEHIFLEVHFNHMHMNSQIGKLEIEINL